MEILCVLFAVLCLAESHWYGIVSDFYRIHDKGRPTLLNHEDRQRPHRLLFWQRSVLFLHASLAIGTVITICNPCQNFPKFPISISRTPNILRRLDPSHGLLRAELFFLSFQASLRRGPPNRLFRGNGPPLGPTSTCANFARTLRRPLQVPFEPFLRASIPPTKYKPTRLHAHRISRLRRDLRGRRGRALFRNSRGCEARSSSDLFSASVSIQIPPNRDVVLC